MKNIKIKIAGIKDNISKEKLLNKLKEKKGIKNVEFNIPEKILSITYQKINKHKIEDYLDDLDVKSEGEIEEMFEKEETYGGKNCILGILLIVLLIYSLLKRVEISELKLLFLPKVYSIICFLFVIPFVVIGFKSIKRGFLNLTHKKMNRYSISLIVIVVSLLFSIYSLIRIFLGNDLYVNNLLLEPIVLIIYLLHYEELLLTSYKNKTKDLLKTLSLTMPSEVTLKVEDDFNIINLDEVRKNDILIVNSGERFTCDGVITSGTTVVDETFITGNSTLVEKKVGDIIYAGTFNYDSKIEYQVEKLPEETYLNEILNVNTNNKVVSKMIDRAVNYNIIFIILFIIFKLILNYILYSTINFNIEDIIKNFIIVFPPSLLLVTPLTIMIARKELDKNNVLIKESEKIEIAGRINTVVFDKTGTLTNGIVTISKIINNSKYEDKELLNIIGSMGKNIDHPIAISIKRYLKQEKIKPTYKFSTEYLSGYGIKAKDMNDVYYFCNKKIVKKLDIINSYKEEEKQLEREGNLVLYLIKNNKIISVVGLKDLIKLNSKKLITGLKKYKLNIIMLSGDSIMATEEVAKELGIEQFYGDMSPEAKHNFIKELQASGKKVLMVGDGMNDIPALKEAKLSAVLETSTNLTSSVSNILIKKDDILKILDLIYIGRKQNRIIKQNIFYTMILNIFLSMNVVDYTSIILTFLLSFLIIVINSLRLRR